MSELNTARDIIEIQYNGNMGFARLSPTFRANIANDPLPVDIKSKSRLYIHIFLEIFVSL